MYCRVIACDFDGTGAVDGHPAPELYAALAAARAQGIVTLLVTGRAAAAVASAQLCKPADGCSRRHTRCHRNSHWLVIDEAHYFFGPQSQCLKYLNSTTGSVCLVAYRPSLLASEAFNAVGAHIFTSTKKDKMHELCH